MGRLTIQILATLLLTSACATNPGNIRDVDVRYVTPNILLFKAISQKELLASGCSVQQPVASPATREFLAKLLAFERSTPRSIPEWEVEYRFAITYTQDGIWHQIFAENIRWTNVSQIDVKIDRSISSIDISAVDLINSYWSELKADTATLRQGC